MKKILVVDDEKDIRDTVAMLLAEEGFEIVTAKDGATAIEKFKKVKPDLVLLDILMPGLKTNEVLARLGRLKHKAPIIFLSVVRIVEASKEKLGNNIADYIEKPFNNKDLIKRVKKVLKVK